MGLAAVAKVLGLAATLVVVMVVSPRDVVRIHCARLHDPEMKTVFESLYGLLSVAGASQ